MHIIKAPCKINISLDITSKREDGYHLIESLFHTVNLYDIISIEKSDKYSIHTNGMFALKDDEEDNIVTKVFNYFKNEMGLINNYNINIEKNIINDSLIESFSRFGADIPFFIRGGLAWVSGIGEKIKNYNFILPYNIILIYPNIHVSTKLAYSKFVKDDFNKSYIFAIKNILDNRECFNKDINFNDVVYNTYNIFEKNVFNLDKRIEDIKLHAENIIKRKVSMSGSGSSFFALYENNDKKIDDDFNKLKSEMNYNIYKLSLI